jgi:hypothetical protein
VNTSTSGRGSGGKKRKETRVVYEHRKEIVVEISGSLNGVVV